MAPPSPSPPPLVFVWKLRKLVDECPPDVGEWSPCGTVFHVKDPPEFKERLFQVYKGKKKNSDTALGSFRRQLLFYKFKRETNKHTREWSFSNPEFTRDSAANDHRMARGPTWRPPPKSARTTRATKKKEVEVEPPPPPAPVPLEVPDFDGLCAGLHAESDAESDAEFDTPQLLAQSLPDLRDLRDEFDLFW
jgi:hypothetical protein